LDVVLISRYACIGTGCFVVFVFFKQKTAYEF